MNSFINPKTYVAALAIIIIAVTAPNISYAQIPVNDLCTNATLLNSSTTCTNVAGTMRLATNTATVGTACGTAATGVDVWYKFVAESAYPVISLSSIGVNAGSAIRIGIYTN